MKLAFVIVAATLSFVNSAEAVSSNVQSKGCQINASPALRCGCSGQSVTCSADIDEDGMVSISLTSSVHPSISASNGYMAAKTDLNVQAYKGSPGVNASCQCELK